MQAILDFYENATEQVYMRTRAEVERLLPAWSGSAL